VALRPTGALRDTERLFGREPVRRFPAELRRTMLRKLVLLDGAKALDELPVPPGNRLDTLGGDRAGQHSIRVNDQWRIGFRWRDGDAFEVAIVDYPREFAMATRKLAPIPEKAVRVLDRAS
jgi:proteic killer suppression protein